MGSLQGSSHLVTTNHKLGSEA